MFLCVPLVFLSLNTRACEREGPRLPCYSLCRSACMRALERRGTPSPAAGMHMVCACVCICLRAWAWAFLSPPVPSLFVGPHLWQRKRHAEHSVSCRRYARCMRACVRACVCARVRVCACVCACVCAGARVRVCALPVSLFCDSLRVWEWERGAEHPAN